MITTIIIRSRIAVITTVIIKLVIFAVTINNNYYYTCDNDTSIPLMNLVCPQSSLYHHTLFVVEISTD